MDVDIFPQTINFQYGTRTMLNDLRTEIIMLFPLQGNDNLRGRRRTRATENIAERISLNAISFNFMRKIFGPKLHHSKHGTSVFLL